MKILSFISASFSLSMIAIGFLFKILHWKGASMLLILGFCCLAFIAIPAIAIRLYRKSAL